jgi:hypothetical protein
MSSRSRKDMARVHLSLLKRSNIIIEALNADALEQMWEPELPEKKM